MTAMPPQNQTLEFTPAAGSLDAVQTGLGAASVRSMQPTVIAFGRLGDMVMLSSVLHLLHRRFGRRCLVIGAGAWNLRLYQSHADVEQVVSFTRHLPFMLSLAWWRALRALRRSSPGPIYVCERVPRQLARIRRLLAVSGVDSSRCLFISDLPDKDEHWADRFIRLGHLTPATVAAGEYPFTLLEKPAPRLSVSEAERLEVDAWLQAKGWLGRRLVLIQAGNFRSMSRRRERWRRLNADDKAWPIGNWVALVRRMLATMPDALVVLCGAAQEGLMLQEIQRAAGSPDVVVAELSLRHLLAMSEAAHSMISVDTGPAHAAAALGLPLVVMFGAESPREWLPRSPSGSAVVGIGGPPVSRRVDQISVEEVFSAWCSLLPGIPKRRDRSPLEATVRADLTGSGERELRGGPRAVPNRPLRPTVFYFCRLGDMVMLSRLLNLLHQRFHMPCQVIGTGSWTSSVYAGHPDVAAVWSLHRHFPFPFDSAWPSVRRALRDSDPGPIYICESHYRQLPRIRRMLKLAGVSPSRCVFLADEPITGPEHLADRLLRVGTRTPAGIQAAAYPVPDLAAVDGPRLYVLDSERAQHRAWLASQGWLGKERIVVQPGNHRSMGPRRDRWRRLNTDDKWWPLERWAALLHKIHDYRPDALIILRGSPEEVPMLQEIKDAANLDAVVVSGHGLRPLFALCDSAHSILSVDSGPAHVAAALSVPLVVLYGQHSPKYWLPRTPSGSAVLGVGGPPETSRVDQVSVEAVFNAWRAIVPRKEAEGGVTVAVHS
jgi:heptosyltransferase-2/heptosyltransferase-3